MNDTDQIETLKALSEVARERERPRKAFRLASVRVSPGSYLAAASVLTFCSALLLRSERNALALLAVAIAWLIVPLLALTDRLEFDGQFLVRCGPIPFLLRRITGRTRELNVREFEKVDTQAVRTLLACAHNFAWSIAAYTKEMRTVTVIYQRFAEDTETVGQFGASTVTA